jgi:Permeases of the drug/metabolite transporter (DMT) superfamily
MPAPTVSRHEQITSGERRGLLRRAVRRHQRRGDAFCRRRNRPSHARVLSLRDRDDLSFARVAFRLAEGARSGRRRHYHRAAGRGVLGFFPWAFSAALQYTTAARGAIGIATIPIQTLIVAAIFGREKLTRRNLLSVALGFAGIAIVFGPEAYRGEVSATGSATG